MKTLSAAIALSIVAGSFAATAASAAPMIRATPVETAQKAENVGYYGHYYGYPTYYYYVPKRKKHFYYYGYGY